MLLFAAAQVNGLDEDVLRVIISLLHLYSDLFNI
jgi:hypothetical protein